MDLIFFETVVVAVTVEDRLLIALFDGSMSDPPTKSACVALLSCEMETGAALSDALCSLLKTQSGQAHDES